MSYRALATDYDGTLATRGAVDDATWAAVDRLKASGRAAVLVTGREVHELFQVCPGLGRFDRVVAENGAILYRPADRSEVALAPRPPDEFVAALQARGVGPISAGRAIVATWEPHREAVEATIRAMGLDLRVIPNKRALMILPPGVDKASGLLAALGELGIGPGEAVGVGDAENDASLLGACGLGVAVANALPALKSLAGLVTDGERGAGVAEVIGRMIAGTLPGDGPAWPGRVAGTGFAGGRPIGTGAARARPGKAAPSIHEKAFPIMATAIREAIEGRTPRADAWPRPVTGDLAYLRAAIVNVFFSGLPGAGDRDWVLIDAGMPGYAGAIMGAAARRFGPGARPSAIVMTHGHFDHVGSLATLAEAWDVPIFAHEMEIPYLTGRSAYPPPDPTVGGGLLALTSWMFPRGPFDFRPRVRPLPADHSVPFLPGWRWIATPGHTAGHVSFFRDGDRTLIAGDAFVTTKQESALAVLRQRREIHGPPAYYTSDWAAARRSVEALSALNPEIAATGHGVPMAGEELRAGLRDLLRDFDEVAYPAHGRYAGRPAIADENGVISVPPEKVGFPPALAFGLAAGALLGLAIGRLGRGRRA